MYKLLLCWRYLCTRYIALVSIISVTLGVATMIVVNSVMEGFTSEMQNRIHGILSDVVLESRSLSGMRDAEMHMKEIHRIAGDSIEAMTPTVVVPAMLSFKVAGSDQFMVRPVQLIGIEETTQSGVSDFSKYLQHEANRSNMSFELREDGYDVRDHQAGPGGPERPQMAAAGRKHRREMARIKAFQDQYYRSEKQEAPAGYVEKASGNNNKDEVQADTPATAGAPADKPGTMRSMVVAHESALADKLPETPGTSSPAANVPTADPFAGLPASPGDTPGPAEGRRFDTATQQHTGAVLGIAMASIRTLKNTANPREGFEDRFLLLPGDDVKLTTVTVGMPPKETSDFFTVVDFYESKMSEYDASFVFVPIRKLQELRGMIDPTYNVGFVNSIQIKLKPGADGEEVRDKLAAVFPREEYVVETWRDKQGPAVGRGVDGNRHSQRTAVFDHYRGGIRHSGHFLHDCGGKNPRYRHPQVARCAGPGSDGYLFGLRAFAGIDRFGRWAGDRLAFCPLYQRDSRPAGQNHRPAGVRSDDLLFL